MRKFIIVLAIIFMSVSFLTSCMKDTSSQAEQDQTLETNRILEEINREIGLPNIVNFQQKKLMKMVFEMCDKADLLCYAYLQCNYTGELIYLGKCIGYGVPFSDQYTSPLKVIDVDRIKGMRADQGADIQVVPQADPNGLYMPTSSDATWLLVVDPRTNESGLAYIEHRISVFPFKIK